MLPRGFGTSRYGDVEGGSVGYRRPVSVVNRPLPYVFVVPEAYRMVVVDAPAAPRVPILSDRENSVRVPVG